MTGIEDRIWLAIASVVVFATWLPHLLFSLSRYRHEHSFRATRGAFVAGMLQIGLLRISLNAIDRAWPGHESLQFAQAITQPILTALLLSGGVLLTISWTVEWLRARRVT